MFSFDIEKWGESKRLPDFDFDGLLESSSHYLDAHPPKQKQEMSKLESNFLWSSSEKINRQQESNKRGAVEQGSQHTAPPVNKTKKLKNLFLSKFCWKSQKRTKILKSNYSIMNFKWKWQISIKSCWLMLNRTVQYFEKTKIYQK